MSPSPRDALDEARLFARLTPDERDQLASLFEVAWVEPGVTVVEEGRHDRSMYVVVSGTARFSREGLDLGKVRAGDHFGELGLAADRPRAATVYAETPLHLLVLKEPRYRGLVEQQPQLAARLLEAIVGSIAVRLEGVTDSVGVLLRDRSLPRRTHVQITVLGQTHTVKTGTRVEHVFPSHLGGRPVVAGLLDRTPVSLSTPITCECTLTPLTSAHWEGARIHRESLGLLVLEAAQRLQPRYTLRTGPSLGFAQRILIEAPTQRLEEIASKLEAEMYVLAGRNDPLREEWWTIEEARDHFLDEGWIDAADLLRISRAQTVPLVSYGKVYALRLGPLAPKTGLLGRFRLVRDDDALLLLYDVNDSPLRPEASGTAVPVSSEDALVREARAVSKQAVAMTRTQERWLATLGITSVGSFNRTCVDGQVAQLIRVSEGFQEKRISAIADAILARGQVRVVCIAGPSSSGKTTFIKRLSVQLQVNGLVPINISLDDYYVDRTENPRDADGDLDFEAFEALRLDLLSRHLEALTRGQRVKTARYDFSTGRSHGDGGPTLQLGPEHVLLLEGIHGLNPGLLPALPPGSVFRIFICPLVQLPFDRLSRMRPSDLRLLRRIVRDRHGRNQNAEINIPRWPKVRAGERRHIFPYQAHADAVFDSSLVYEISVLKVFAERYLLEVPSDHPAYTTAFRLLQVLDRWVTIYPDHVPPTSILREFIGGSGFEY